MKTVNHAYAYCIFVRIFCTNQMPIFLTSKLNSKPSSHFGEEQYKNNTNYGKHNDDVTTPSPGNCHTWHGCSFFNSFAIVQWVCYNYCHQYHNCTENRARYSFYGNYFPKGGKSFLALAFYFLRLYSITGMNVRKLFWKMKFKNNMKCLDLGMKSRDWYWRSTLLKIWNLFNVSYVFKSKWYYCGFLKSNEQHFRLTSRCLFDFQES